MGQKPGTGWVSYSESDKLITNARHNAPQGYGVISDNPRLAYEIKHPSRLSFLMFETEIEKRPSQQILFSFEFSEPQTFTRSVRVTCPTPKCTFELPLEGLVWIPRLPIRRILLKLEGIDNIQDSIRFKVLRSGVASSSSNIHVPQL